MIATYFIRRPKTAIVFSLFITLFGVLAILRLPVAQYPSITPPVVQVTATYTGRMQRPSSKQ
nr:efflux RND transporter permease subunit [Nitritalea halalkaliphila]